MKYIDKGIAYIPIKKDATQEDLDELKKQYKDKTVIFLRSGDINMQKILLNFIVPR